jgi:hypothetical protein
LIDPLYRATAADFGGRACYWHSARLNTVWIAATVKFRKADTASAAGPVHFG